MNRILSLFLSLLILIQPSVALIPSHQIHFCKEGAGDTARSGRRLHVVNEVMSTGSTHPIEVEMGYGDSLVDAHAAAEDPSKTGNNRPYIYFEPVAHTMPNGEAEMVLKPYICIPEGFLNKRLEDQMRGFGSIKIVASQGDVNLVKTGVSAEETVTVEAEQGTVNILSSPITAKKGITINGQNINIEQLKTVVVSHEGDTYTYEEIPDGDCSLDAGDGDLIIIAGKKYREVGAFMTGRGTKSVSAGESIFRGGLNFAKRTVTTTTEDDGLFSSTTDTTEDYVETYRPSMSSFVKGIIEKITTTDPAKPIVHEGTVDVVEDDEGVVRFEAGKLIMTPGRSKQYQEHRSEHDAGPFGTSRLNLSGSGSEQLHACLVAAKKTSFVSKDVLARGLVLKTKTLELLKGAMVMFGAATASSYAHASTERTSYFAGGLGRYAHTETRADATNVLGSNIYAGAIYFIHDVLEGNLQAERGGAGGVCAPQTPVDGSEEKLTTILLESSRLETGEMAHAYLSILQTAMAETQSQTATTLNVNGKGLTAPTVSLPNFKGNAYANTMQALQHIAQYAGHTTTALKMMDQIRSGNWANLGQTILQQFTNISVSITDTSMTSRSSRDVASELYIGSLADSRIKQIQLAGIASVGSMTNTVVDLITARPLAQRDEFTFDSESNSVTFNPLTRSVGFSHSESHQEEKSLRHQHSRLIVNYADTSTIKTMDALGLDTTIGNPQQRSNIKIGRVRLSGTKNRHEKKSSALSFGATISMSAPPSGHYNEEEKESVAETANRAKLDFVNTSGSVESAHLTSADITQDAASTVAVGTVVRDELSLENWSTEEESPLNGISDGINLAQAAYGAYAGVQGMVHQYRMNDLKQDVRESALRKGYSLDAARELANGVEALVDHHHLSLEEAIALQAAKDDVFTRCIILEEFYLIALFFSCPFPMFRLPKQVP